MAANGRFGTTMASMDGFAGTLAARNRISSSGTVADAAFQGVASSSSSLDRDVLDDQVGVIEVVENGGDPVEPGLYDPRDADSPRS